MFKYDQAAFDRLLKEFMRENKEHLASFKTGTEIIKDDYGVVIAAVPFVSAVLKDDSQILADLSNHQPFKVNLHARN